MRDYAGAQRELDLAAPTMGGRAEFLLPKQVIERRFGHWKDAVRDGEKALSLNPRDPVYAGVLIETYRALRMYSEGEKVANEMIAKLPPESTESLWGYKCDFELALGRLDDARAVVEATPGQVQWKNSMSARIELNKREVGRGGQNPCGVITRGKGTERCDKRSADSNGWAATQKEAVGVCGGQTNRGQEDQSEA